MWKWTVVGLAVTVATCGPAADEGGDSLEVPAEEPARIEEPAPTGGPVQIVAEGIISTNDDETFPAEDPQTGDLWFSIIGDSFDEQAILHSRWTGSGWERPMVAPFSGIWGDRAPRFSPDGSALYFTSNRPRSGGMESGDMNIWRVDRTPAGWSEPQLVEGGVNSPSSDIHVSVTDSAIWVASDRPGGFGRSDLYRVDRNGQATHPGSPLNDDLSQPDVWVSPDESWMILAITDHPDGYGGDDLYVSFWEGDGWSTPENLGPEVNTTDYEYGPWVTSDGTALLFTSHRGGQSDVYAVSLEDLDRIR